MSKYTPVPISTTLSNSAATTINNNFQGVSTAIENTLSRDGTSPNQMLSDLDMNNNDILNAKDVHVDRLFLDGSEVQQGSVTDALLKSNNLSDVTSVSASRDNLGLGTIATGDNSTFKFIIPTFAEASTTSIPEDANYVFIEDRYSKYKRVVSQPSHSMKFQNGTQWWELDEPSPDVKMAGAVGDGLANDNAAFVAINSYGKTFKVPPGSYDLGVSYAPTQSVILEGGILENTVFGYVVGSSDRQWKSRADRPSDSFTDTPTDYHYIKELSSIYMLHNNAAGYQEFFDSDTGGRTNVPGILIEGFHSGYGDMPGVSVRSGITRHPDWASVTEWTGRNSLPLYDGQSGASSSHVNLYGDELHCVDYGFSDVAAIGIVRGFNKAGAKTAAYTSPWIGARLQSTGALAADAAYQVVGKWNVGVDFTGMTLPANNAVIAIPSGGRIYMASDASVPGTTWFAGDTGLSFGNNWIDFSGSTLRAVVGGTATLQVSSTAITTTGNVNAVGGFRVSGIQVVGAKNTGWTGMTGTQDKATTYDVATITLAQLAGRVAALQAALTTHGLIGT